MKRVLGLCCSIVTLVVLVGCEKKPDAPVPSEGTTATPQAQAPVTPPAATEQALAATTLDLEKVPVEEQYEGEAEAEITKANFEQQLDTLEKEIQAP